MLPGKFDYGNLSPDVATELRAGEESAFAIYRGGPLSLLSRQVRCQRKPKHNLVCHLFN